ncbi:hypothetical protein MMC31_003964 [Peltigera leucophlebia]|nr:hypothetical protein [Peltigera leucophlebia]
MALKIRPNSSKSSTGPTDENTSQTSQPTRRGDRATSQRRTVYFFAINLEDNAEQWYRKLPAATKGDWEELRTAFTPAFQMDEVDDETRISELRLELANMKQGETENIADFITRADILARELPGSEVHVGIAVTRGILDPDQKERLLFECAKSKNSRLAASGRWSKHFTILVVKTAHLIRHTRGQGV